MKRKLFNLWVLVAAAALVFATSCESDELDYVKEKPGTGDTETPIDPPTISFNGRIAIDESGEWPVASVEVNVSEDADYWYWMFEETRAYAEWTQKSPAKTKIEFPVLRTGAYTLSIKAENAGGESEIATDTFSAAIPEKYGDVFAAIDWTLNDAKTAVNFRISTTDATENWYYEFAEADNATEIPEEITDEIVKKFTKGTLNEFTIDDFEINKTYKMTVIAENEGGRKATSATVGYDYEESSSEGEALAAIKYAINDDKDKITFTITTTKATSAWYYEFVESENATELPDDIENPETAIPDSFEEGDDTTLEFDFERNSYTITVIAENEYGRAVTSLDIDLDFTKPMLDLGQFELSDDDTLSISYEPSVNTDKLWYIFTSAAEAPEVATDTDFEAAGFTSLDVKEGILTFAAGEYAYNTRLMLTMVAVNSLGISAKTATTIIEKELPSLTVGTGMVNGDGSSISYTIIPSKNTTEWYHKVFKKSEVPEITSEEDVADFEKVDVATAENGGAKILSFTSDEYKDEEYALVLVPFRAGLMGEISVASILFGELSFDVISTPMGMNIDVRKGTTCTRYVIGAREKDTWATQHPASDSDGEFAGSKSFETAAKESLSYYDDPSSAYGIMRYNIFTDSYIVPERYLVFDNYMRNGYDKDNSTGLAVELNKTYIIGIYAEFNDGSSKTYFDTWTKEDEGEFTGEAVVNIEVTASDYNSADTRISADFCSILYYGVSETKINDTEATIRSMLASRGAKNTTYTGPIEEHHTMMSETGSTIYVWALAIDKNGNVGGWAVKEVSRKAVEFTSPIAKITGAEITQKNYLSADINLAFEGAEEIRILNMTRNAFVGGSDKNKPIDPPIIPGHPEIYTDPDGNTDAIKESQLRQFMCVGDGVAKYSAAQASHINLELLAFNFTDTSTSTDVKYTVYDQMFFAMPVDANGDFGPIVNLASLHNRTDNFMTDYFEAMEAPEELTWDNTIWSDEEYNANTFLNASKLSNNISTGFLISDIDGSTYNLTQIGFMSLFNTGNYQHFKQTLLLKYDIDQSIGTDPNNYEALFTLINKSFKDYNVSQRGENIDTEIATVVYNNTFEKNPTTATPSGTGTEKMTDPGVCTYYNAETGGSIFVLIQIRDDGRLAVCACAYYTEYSTYLANRVDLYKYIPGHYLSE